ncbi:PH (Pleckstrin Homology) domain-containing protein [Pseudonocardia hierapolitana]|uniref:PH (Pleckstrin Homology) domain-containing protein n=1 Tax=Pseudonocardia hierapolitana TaxID=1128676 RepID=A0A561SUP6_9PSEU|nr:PH domain-containing protein [Pseudonocardia hierapolitana]TWF78546.1 PH (Pleckstrin Homology) domain-containing protein [Pseudonocardia hierapolitana]
MAYPDDLLVEDEQVVVHRHPHWKMLVVPVVVLLLVVGVASFLAALVSAQSWAPWAWLGLALAGLALAGRFTVYPVVRWRTTHFVVTDRRVLVREGVFTRQGMDIPLKRISSVQFRQGLLERMLGAGTLVVESDSDESLEFDDVPGVRRVHTVLYNEVAQ